LLNLIRPIHLAVTSL